MTIERTAAEIVDAMIQGATAAEALSGSNAPLLSSPKTSDQLRELVTDCATLAKSHSGLMERLAADLGLADAAARQIAEAAYPATPGEVEGTRDRKVADIFKKNSESKRKAIMDRFDARDGENAKTLRALLEIEKRADAVSSLYPSAAAMITATSWNEPDKVRPFAESLHSADLATLELARKHCLSQPGDKRPMAAALLAKVSALPPERRKLLSFSVQQFSDEIAGAEFQKLSADVTKIKLAVRARLDSWRGLNQTPSTNAQHKISRGLARRAAGMNG